MWKKRLGWLALLLAALILYLFENNSGTRLTLWAVVLLPLLGAVPLLPDPRITLAWQVPETVRRGEEAACSLTIRREGRFFAPALSGRIEIANLLTSEERTLPLFCAPRPGETVIPFTLKPAHCGTVTLRAARLQLRDPFGLFARSLKETQARFLVVPILFPVEVRFDGSWQDSGRYSPERAGSDPSETLRIREYVPGDPVRQIHWKLSEKLDRSLVRDFGLPLEEQAVLTLEEAPASPDEVDGALDLLFSVGRALCGQGLPARVAVPGTPADTPADDARDAPEAEASDTSSAEVWDTSALESTAAPVLHGQEDWLSLRDRLLSAPLRGVRLRLEGISVSS